MRLKSRFLFILYAELENLPSQKSKFKAGLAAYCRKEIEKRLKSNGYCDYD